LVGVTNGKQTLKQLCPVCKRELRNNNKMGYCNLHRARIGIDNPNYGNMWITNGNENKVIKK
jgi:Zn-finger nucleic acid-binding protein